MEVEKVRPTKMEELKMDEDDNIKETSLEEDILGAQSLLMSESDDDNTETSKKASPQKKISPKGTKRIIDSDDENNKQQQGVHNDDTVCGHQDNEIGSKKQKKKTSVLIESDSENDTKIDNNNLIETATKTKNRFMSLIDSESENEEEPNQITEKSKPKTKIHKKSVVKSSSEAENSDSEEKLEKSQKKSKKLKRTVKKNSSSGNNNFPEKSSNSSKYIIRNSSDSETCDNEDKETKQKISSLVDSESDAKSQSGNDSEMDLDASARAANFENNNNDNDSKGKDRKTKIMRASAKKALDEMQAIQSEQQRLHREAHISIPYHKPKKHTLQEFLKRRTLMQPHISLQNGSPVTAVGHMRRIKMTTEEMEEYAKLMDERAKEAKEFFKSESEDEEKEDKVLKKYSGVVEKLLQQQSLHSEDEEELVYKDNEGVLDKPTEEHILEVNNTLKESSHLNQIEIEYNTNIPDINIGGEQNIADDVQLTEAEIADILDDDLAYEISERPTCSKVMITEVIELPKLDMNTIKMSPVKKHTPRPSLSIKQLLNEKNLTGSPSLSGDPNKLIDLETGDLIEKKPSGIENLMLRLMTSNKTRKPKTSETCNILSTENGKLEITKVNVSLTENKDTNKEPKPWAAYFELKQKLKEVIKKKRLEDLHKKQEEELEYSKCLADDDEYDEEDAEEFEPDAKPKQIINMVDDEENILDDEDEQEVNTKCRKNIEEVNNEDENTDDIENNEDDEEKEEDEDEDDGNDEEEDESDCNDEEEEEKITDKTKRRNRIIKAFDDSDEEGDRDDIDFLKTQPPTTQPIIFETQTAAKVSLEDEENELMTLCSGTFETQKTVANALMSQIPLTQNNGKTVDDDELMELCSGTFETQLSTETQMKTQPIGMVENLKKKSKTIFSSDEEQKEFEELSGSKESVKKLTKKLKKRRAKLGFSDDEDDDEEEGDIGGNNTEDDNNEEDLEPAHDEPETFVDYDSEENEILVQMTKKDKVKQAANFFEKEAELSESEWGSADEDENNLDKYDIELGDEDEFDREKLRTELGQIHARKMLDEDLREVRKIQELLLEDEETDGIGRQRTFKWKNAEAGFSLDDGPRDENADGQNGDSGDEMNEHQWRKIRYEREQFLKEQGLKPDSQDMSSTLPNTTIPSANNTTNTMMTSKKIQIISAKKTSASSSASRKSSPFLISKGISAMHKKSVRGSFLVRDKETLKRLAGLTKGTSSSVHTSDASDSVGTVSIKSSKPKNFVFATLTEEEHENLKRKADDLLNSSHENDINIMKKAKIEPRRNKCFIDQLL